MGWGGFGGALALVAYGLLVAGAVHNAILAPPSSGQFVDSAGKERVLSIRLGQKNLNRQYSIEGLSAGLLVVLGSVGLILLTTANSVDNTTRVGKKGGNARALQIIAGFICFAVGFNGVSGLMHQKLPAYLLHSV